MNDNDSRLENYSQPPTPASVALRILIVEDDREVAQAISEIIIHLGHVPCACSHVEEALKFLETQKVDLMLVDYRMPDLTGLDLVFILKQEGRNIPVIMMTGYAETVERVSAGRRDEFIVLKKPITIQALAAAVEESLRSIGEPA
jgi:two-component system response regulator HydG